MDQYKYIATRMTSAPLFPLTSTYRLQLHAHLTFAQVSKLVPYLAQLGISTLYLAPIFRASPGSTHGYDVVDHEQLDPSLGTEDDFAALAATARKHRLSILVDLIPNHMGIHEQHNRWWREVLQHGACTPYAITLTSIGFRPSSRKRARSCCQSWAISSATSLNRKGSN